MAQSTDLEHDDRRDEMQVSVISQIKNAFILCAVSLLMAALGPFECFSCEIQPEEQRVPYQDLIRRTSRIAIASPVQVDEKSPSIVTYRFKVEKVLKGEMGLYFEIQGRSKGFSGMDTDCEIYPGFDLKKRYLIFLDKPYHELSFQELVGNNNSWPSKVADEIAKQK